MIFYLGHKVEDKIDVVTRVNGNKAKSWEYGYNEEYDVIIISKDGTLGDIFYVNGIHIGLPHVPTDRKKIINWDKTEKNQKWKRKEPPKGLNSKTQYNEEYNDYIEEEIERRKNGVYVYIKGKPVYFTGLAYYFYQWNLINIGAPTFRIIQNELMIYWEACKADYRCYGICYVKNRRFGWSTICNAELLYSGTMHNEKELGIISKEGSDASKLFGRLVRTFKKLPCFFRPIYDGNKTPKKEIFFAEPNGKRKTDEENSDYEDEALDTVIRWHTTTLNSMDGDAIFRSALDEVGKFPKDCRFNAYWNVVKTSHTVGEDITGKAMVGSTVNHLDQGGREFKEVYDTSNPNVRNENDETISGLYSLFIPAEYGIQGYYDVYGFCITEDPKEPVKNDQGKIKINGSITFLENKFRGLKETPDILNEELRKFPRKEAHAFRASSEECEFNINKLIEQQEHNDVELEEKSSGGIIIGNNDIERGNFIWKDGIQDTEVIWTPDPEGRFWLRKDCHPPLEFRNKKEKIFKNGILAWGPMAEDVGCFGVDPYNRDKSADGRGSKGAIHLSTKTNTSTLPNEAFILEYLDRASKVTIFFEEVIMAMVYFSMPMLSELSNEAFLQYVADRGYRHFSLNNPFKNYSELNPTEKKLGGAPPQNDKIADQQFYAIESYIVDHVGVSMDNRIRPKGYMGNMPFTRTLEQWKDVDLKNRTKYDAYISSSLSRLGNQRRQKKKETEKPKPFNPFPRYDNSGSKSIAI
ncbi:hypothetical protein [Wenyingzhuangia sp. 2_MG-2023]|uniref:hypothetical protein n=1 Tax=Wenyingzhuangia sp. 2_MG-2023 TaxID=3062639 RepID=UPI0026E268AC|nr:hypothetical protein [Wenyingzhuangia sp. 2_MG-2023]MDO6737093.1 hypothetical protein [Wenyingzhuangia sp. 2_MG-2023]